MNRLIITLTAMITFGLLSGCDGAEERDDFVGQIAGSMKRDNLPGATETRRQCGTCHYLDKSVRKVGPSLKGIYGRAPSIKSIPVDIWNEATLDAWIESPTSVDPKTRMKIPGIKDAEMRKQMIEYLKTL